MIGNRNKEILMATKVGLRGTLDWFKLSGQIAVGKRVWIKKEKKGKGAKA